MWVQNNETLLFLPHNLPRGAWFEKQKIHCSHSLNKTIFAQYFAILQWRTGILQKNPAQKSTNISCWEPGPKQKLYRSLESVYYGRYDVDSGPDHSRERLRERAGVYCILGCRLKYTHELKVVIQKPPRHYLHVGKKYPYTKLAYGWILSRTWLCNQNIHT